MKEAIITSLPPLDYMSKEALNTLGTNLTFVGGDSKKILFTSCRPKEGKSHLVMCLLRTMATMGKQVVLVDGDLRKSVLAARYGIRTDTKVFGLSHFLAGMVGISEIIYQTNIPNAHLILAGHDVVNSLPLLTTKRLPLLMDELTKRYDMVLVDSPPIGVLIDAAQIARHCDGVVFVVAEKEIYRRELLEAKRQIESTGCPILGAVLNKTAFDSRASKKYYRRTNYTHYNEAYEGKEKK